MFLISRLSSREHMFKELCEFMGGTPSWRVTPTSHVWWPLI